MAIIGHQPDWFPHYLYIFQVQNTQNLVLHTSPLSIGGQKYIWGFFIFQGPRGIWLIPKSWCASDFQLEKSIHFLPYESIHPCLFSMRCSIKFRFFWYTTLYVLLLISPKYFYIYAQKRPKIRVLFWPK